MLTSESTYAVDDGERQLIRSLSTQVVAPQGWSVDDPEPFSNRLPLAIRTRLQDLADASGRGEFVLFHGIALDTFPDLPDTPVRHTTMQLSHHWTTGLLSLVAQSLGAMVGYAEEKNGALVHDVHPVRGEEQHFENTGSVRFDLHTENVHHPLRPDFLGLLCLRQDHERVAELRIASARDAVAGMGAEQIGILRGPRFHSLYPTSFTRGDGGVRPRTGPHPVLFGSAQEPLMRFNAHNTEALDDEADVALRAFAAALEGVCRRVLLQPGDLVVLNNHMVAHGRAAFRPRYDGQDRWLRRFFALRGMPWWVTTMMPRPRVLPPLRELLAAG
jgi:L-asparagine oxygenase